MTVHERDIYRRIEGSEFTNKNWNSEQAEKAPQLRLMRERFNQVSFWVASVLLSARQTSTQQSCFKFFCMLAVELLELKNWNGVGEIVAGLQNVSVSRLHLESHLDEALARKMEDRVYPLFDVITNFKLYREVVAAEPSTSMCIPYLPLHLRDILGETFGLISFLPLFLFVISF